MAGWSALRSRSGLDCGAAAGDDSGNENEIKVRNLFNQVLSVSMNETRSRGCIRPMPALLGDGQSLDLFRLFLVVRKRGGFDMVNGFWNFVVKELGLDLQATTSVKLIYFKYLYELEIWLSGNSREKRSENEECESVKDFGLISLKLEKEFKSFLSDQKAKKKKLHSLENRRDGIGIIKGMENEVDLFDTKAVHQMCNGVGNRLIDDDEKVHEFKDHCTYVGNNSVVLDPSTGRSELNSRKRKRESLSRMLNWVIQVAKCPDAPSIGRIPLPSEREDLRGNELWVQALRARDALLRRRWVDSNAKPSVAQNNQKIHPSIYEDFSLPSNQSPCTKRHQGLVKLTNTSSKIDVENRLNEQALPWDDDLLATGTTLSPTGDEDFYRHVAIGPLFQAEVPEWSGKIDKGDSKWLGTRIWPLVDGEQNAPTLMHPIGGGRPDLCGCWGPGSVECVRFHIAEKRMKLKRELGEVFYHWGFDQMGEEVSLRWTADEENRFKNMVKLNPPSLGKCFWDGAHKFFPKKTRKELVSYYFNVFVVQRRSYQNRVTPKEIDSDNDEAEYGSASDGYGHQAVKGPDSNHFTCVENKQCSDFE